MANHTIAQAIDHVRRLLDANGDTERWSDVNLKDSLRYALDRVYEDYIREGGRRFDEVLSVTTTALGQYDISTKNPISIKGVSVIQGNRRWPISPFEYEEMKIPSFQEHNIEIRFTPRIVMSTTNSDPLVGSGATPKNSWLSFEELVIVTAAIHASIIDDEVRMSLINLENALKQTVYTQEKIPKSYNFPGRKIWLSAILGYVWVPQTNIIQVIRRDY